MSNTARNAVILVTVAVTALVLGAWLSSDGPTPPAVDPHVQQLIEVHTALRDERAKFADAVRLMQNLGHATETNMTPEQLAVPEVAEAMEQAKQRIREWRQ